MFLIEIIYRHYFKVMSKKIRRGSKISCILRMWFPFIFLCNFNKSSESIISFYLINEVFALALVLLLIFFL